MLRLRDMLSPRFAEIIYNGFWFSPEMDFVQAAYRQSERIIDGVVHYGVANMPGAVPRTSTLALTNATLGYAKRLAKHGWRAACKADRALALGLNVIEGRVVYPGVAEAFGLPLEELETVL